MHDLYTYDNGLLLNKKTGHIYCNLDRDNYIRVRRDGKEYRAHRIIWELFNGPIPETLLIDHIDGDALNNRIENLRLVNRSQNNWNSKAKGPLCKGITKVGNKYRAKIMYKGETYSIGTFNTVEEASREYKEAAELLYGEYAPKPQSI